MNNRQEQQLRTKTRRVVTILEKFLGEPRQQTRVPSPLDMLIATILSQNTNDKNSHRAFTELRRRFPRWDEVAHAPLRSIKSAIKTGGMAHQKAPRIKETLHAVKKRYGSYNLAQLKRKPSDDVITELTQLHGVGFKTASCVLLFSLGRDVFPVDTHVHRICNRLGLSNGATTPEKTFMAMKNLVPKGKSYSFHTNLIRFGRKVCRSASPVCSLCPLYDECVFEEKGAKTVSRKPQPSYADHDFMLLDNIRVDR